MYLYCLWSPQSATRRSSKWRFYTAVVRPLSTKRSLDPDDPASYRPISNLCFVSKIVEKVMDARLCAHAHTVTVYYQCVSPPVRTILLRQPSLAPSTTWLELLIKAASVLYYFIRPFRGFWHCPPFCPGWGDEEAVWSRPRWKGPWVGRRPPERLEAN